MFLGSFRARLFVAALLLGTASCAGGAQQSMPPPSPAGANASAAAAHTYALSAGVFSTSVTLRSSAALPADAVTLFQERAGVKAQSIGTTCPPVPPILLKNPFTFPITIPVVSFTVKLPCTVQNALFGVSFYQIVPVPNPVSPTKLGDVTVNGSVITFTSTAKSLTLAPQTTSQITILPETSKSEVAFPVAPGSTTNLTANASNLPSGLNFTYTTATGGTTYSVACFNAFDSNGIVPALQSVPLVGVPSFYCHINPANGSAITFGQTVTFAVVAPPPDRAIFEPDGPVTGFECTLSSSCNVPQFTVPTTYQNFIASNAEDLRLCVPATPNLDCNKVDNDPQGGSRTTVSRYGDFQLLVADDPTYKPGPAVNPPSTTPHAVPWDGLFGQRIALNGPCRLNTNSDNENGDVPPGYSDSEQTGTGPNAEFDVTPTGTGTCSITVTEDSRFITDFSDPNHPVPRTASVAIKIQ